MHLCRTVYLFYYFFYKLYRKIGIFYGLGDVSLVYWPGTGCYHGIYIDQHMHKCAVMYTTYLIV